MGSWHEAQQQKAAAGGHCAVINAAGAPGRLWGVRGSVLQEYVASLLVPLKSASKPKGAHVSKALRPSLVAVGVAPVEGILQALSINQIHCLQLLPRRQLHGPVLQGAGQGRAGQAAE